jgi:putative hemolysin
MEPRDNGEPPENGKKRRSIASFLKDFFHIFAGDNVAHEKKDELIKKSVEQFSTNLASANNVLGAQVQDMIFGIVDISSTSVKEIMVPRVDIIGLEMGSSIKDVIKLVKEHGHSRMPVYEESLDNIAGILYIKDLFVQGAVNVETISKSVIRPSFFVPENKKVSDLLKEMQAKKIHLAIVVDEYGGTAGLVTLEDILEEIVGEIEDEYDLEAPPIKKIDNLHYIVKGSLPIYELNEGLNLELPEDQFETVGGVIYDIVGSLPVQGTMVSYKELKFTADRVEGQRITRVIVELPPPTPTEEGNHELE